MDAQLIRHRASELSVVGTLFLGDDQFFTIENRGRLLPEGCHTLTEVSGGVGIGGFPVISGERDHGKAGTVGIGLQARRYTLAEGALALQLMLATVTIQLARDLE